MTGFNFDRMLKLHQTDPQEFERERARLIEETISRAPEHIQEKLRQLQGALDRVHASSSPMEGLCKMQAMMLESATALQLEMGKLVRTVSEEVTNVR